MLPAFTFASISRWTCAASLRDALRREVNGRVVPISPRLAREETEALVDLLESTAGMTVEVVSGREGTTASPDRVFLWESATGETPTGVDASVVLYPDDELPPRRFDLPPVMRALAHALAHHVGVEFQRDARRASLGRWLMEFADTPGTAKAFLQGALRVAARATSDEEALVAAGVASTVDWLLRPVRADAREYALAFALKSPAYLPAGEDRPSTVGRALAELLNAGIVEHLPERNDLTVDLRTPCRNLHGWLRLSWELRFRLWREEFLRLAPSLSSSLERLREDRERLAQLGPVKTTAAWWPPEIIEAAGKMLGETSEVLYGVVELSQGEGRQEFASQLAELIGRVRPCIALDLGEMNESAYWLDAATRRTYTWMGSRWEPNSLLARGVLSEFVNSPALFIADNADALPDIELQGLVHTLYRVGACAFLLLMDRLRSEALRPRLSFVLSPRAGLAGELKGAPLALEADDLRETFGDRVGDLRVAAGLRIRLPPEDFASLLGTEGLPSSSALLDAGLAALTPEEWRVVEVLFTGPSPGTHRDVVQLLAPFSSNGLDWMQDIGLLGDHCGRLRLSPAWCARPAVDRLRELSIHARLHWVRASRVLRFLLEQPRRECREGAFWVEAVSLRHPLFYVPRSQFPAGISETEFVALTLLAFTLDLDDLPDAWLKNRDGFQVRFTGVFRSEARLLQAWTRIEATLRDESRLDALNHDAALRQFRDELLALIGEFLPAP